MSMPNGDPEAVRGVAARLRSEADELDSIIARSAGPTELPRNQGGAADRSREVAAGLRERAGWISNRLASLALELDRGADWLDEARLAAEAAGETW